MNFDSLIQAKILEEVQRIFESRLEEVKNTIIISLSMPEHQSWGRYLTTQQAMRYTGFKSINGFKEFCRSNQIIPFKQGKRTIRYDREQLDYVLTNGKITEYIKNLNK